MNEVSFRAAYVVDGIIILFYLLLYILLWAMSSIHPPPYLFLLFTSFPISMYVT